MIREHDEDLFTQICKILFRKNFNSLIYCSPLILSDLLNLVTSGQNQLHFFKDKLNEVFK